MQLTWHPAQLPEDPRDCGHGVGLCSLTADGRKLVAFVNDFAWLHDGADSIVHFTPGRLPADAAAATELRQAFAAILRARRTEGTLPAGFQLTVNG